MAYRIHYPYNTYFLTFQVVGWADIFSREIYREIIVDCMQHCIDNKGLNIHAFVIMTNHVHVIWQSDEEKLYNIVRDFKRVSARKILDKVKNSGKESRKEWLLMIFRYHARKNKRSGKYQLWTHENRAIHLRSTKRKRLCLKYIHMNPVRAGWVLNPAEFKYSSYSAYCNEDCLLPIEILSFSNIGFL